MVKLYLPFFRKNVLSMEGIWDITWRHLVILLLSFSSRFGQQRHSQVRVQGAKIHAYMYIYIYGNKS